MWYWLKERDSVTGWWVLPHCDRCGWFRCSGESVTQQYTTMATILLRHTEKYEIPTSHWTFVIIHYKHATENNGYILTSPKRCLMSTLTDIAYVWPGISYLHMRRDVDLAFFLTCFSHHHVWKWPMNMTVGQIEVLKLQLGFSLFRLSTVNHCPQLVNRKVQE